MYDSTLTVAQQFPEKNKFRLKGTYQSSSGAEIRLNAMNVPEGSVTVTAGSQKLVENQDYTVDYMLGRVTIINEGILNSGVPIKISLENNSMFGIQNKTLLGIHADYEINKDYLIVVLYIYNAYHGIVVIISCYKTLRCLFILQYHFRYPKQKLVTNHSIKNSSPTLS